MNKATVLLSGGIDSASVAMLLKAKGLAVRGLFIDFGQASREMEQKSVAQLKEIIGIPVDQIQVNSLRSYGAGELVGRNAFLIFAAALLGNCDSGGIAIGVHSGTAYYDCSSDFMQKIDALIQQCSDGKLSVLAPFVRWSKDDVYSYFLSQGIPLENTYSCEAGSSPPCGRCTSCLDRARLECSLKGASSD
ncbi:7-cyano-7-deazaguanine synthase [Bradyrhizobium canariense]|uniref:7-cyano-7-deazaguanine synthase n=1 Tax=Bradyrhizobium canariense TaxID=255045 RepID=UPI001B8A89AE|nr:7-cyano-7-deazaguanine synthase [Bradyrhizobium canariense]MBR0955231.1 7-cyano-7-deazaguanine synthase [Bradyrhizobium canariense]